MIGTVLAALASGLEYDGTPRAPHPQCAAPNRRDPVSGAWLDWTDGALLMTRDAAEYSPRFAYPLPRVRCGCHLCNR